MEIRTVNCDDNFDNISKIYTLSWKAAYQSIIPQNYLDALPENHWSDCLRSGQWESFVVIDRDQYIATSALCPARDNSMVNWGEIVSLYVLPAYWGQGVGKLLLNTVVDQLAQMGYADTYLWVLEANRRARRFYEQNGFTRSGDQLQITIADRQLTELRYLTMVFKSIM